MKFSTQTEHTECLEAQAYNTGALNAFPVSRHWSGRFADEVSQRKWVNRKPKDVIPHTCTQRPPPSSLPASLLGICGYGCSAPIVNTQRATAGSTLGPQPENGVHTPFLEDSEEPSRCLSLWKLFS